MKIKSTNSLIFVSLLFTGCSTTNNDSISNDNNSTTLISTLSLSADLVSTTLNTTENLNPTFSETSTTSITTSTTLDMITTVTSESFDLGNGDTETRLSTGEMISNCGNLIVENSEECDDGLSGSAVCTKYCKFSFCGDGYVNLIIGEECDDGNPTDYDDCSNGCEKSRWVFLTSDYIGPPNFGGINKADEFCQNDANKFGFIGNYKAWLSDSDPNNDPIIRLDDFSVFDGWYRLPSNPPIPIGKGSDFQVNLPVPINIMLSGSKDLIAESVWTNTKPTGFAVDYTNNCNNWTTNGNSFSTIVGSPQSITIGWTEAGGKNCGSGVGSKLYCFETN